MSRSSSTRSLPLSRQLYAVVSARLLETATCQRYQSQEGRLTVLIFLSGNGSLALTDPGSTKEINIQHGTSVILRGRDGAQQISWSEANTFLEIMTDDYFFASLLETLALDPQGHENILCHYGPEADFGPIATRLAHKIGKGLKTSASLIRNGFHCPAMTRFILAMMLKTKNPRHFRLEFQPECLRLSDTRYLKVARHVEQKLASAIHVRELASAAAQSHFHFIRTFKARTGQSPHVFIQERRLRKAEHLLAESGMSLSHISQECGFSSQSHFTTTFKQHVGITPGHYRDQYHS
jgi:AraC-like DNA-binding protein